MRGVYLSYIGSSETQKRLVPRLEEHVILPEITEYDVMLQIKACGLSRLDTKIVSKLVSDVEQIPFGCEVSGVVTKVGSSVSKFVVGDSVTGLLPLDTECPGCAEYCTVPEYCLVLKPAAVSHINCAASLRGVLRGFTALHHQTKLSPGSIVLLCSAVTGEGLIMLQMCEAIGSKIIATVNSPDEASVLKKLHPSLMRVLDLSSAPNLVETVLQETGGLGVHCIIDNGVSPGYDLADFLIESAPLRRQLEQESHRHGYEVTSPSSSTGGVALPTKHQLISCLATLGHWVTSQPSLQLDPPESECLLMKSASLHFLFEPTWVMSGGHQGDYLHMLHTAVKMLEEGSLKPYVFKTVVLEQVCEEVVRLSSYGLGKVVMRTES